MHAAIRLAIDAMTPPRNDEERAAVDALQKALHANRPQAEASTPSTKIDVPFVDTGVQLNIVEGLTICVYRSRNDGRMVIEIETGESPAVEHRADGVPCVKVVLNDWVISDEEINS